MTAPNLQPDQLSLEPAEGSPVQYVLRLTTKDNSRSVKEKRQDGNISKFSAPVTSTQTPKIYIIRKGGEILYIGYTSQPINSRLWFGLNPKHQANYHGYGWMQEEEVELTVWVFQSFTQNEKENEALKRLIQNLEADLVYYVRQHTGRWPAHQREIHFGNEYREEVEKWVEIIIGEWGMPPTVQG